MSRKFLVPIDLSKNELQNAVIQNLSGSPASPVKGQIYMDSTTNVLYYYNGSGWINAGGISAGLLSARPTVSSSNAGTFYYATDNGLIYYSNGTSWTSSNFFGSPANLASSAADGSALTYSRSDHAHRHAAADHAAIKISDLASPSTDVAFANNKITGLKDPTLAQDAATKAYVDTAIQGLNVHDYVKLIQKTAMTGTYTAGSTGADGGTGVGATFSFTAASYPTIDSVSYTTNDRILLVAQTDATQNGIYYVSSVGSTIVLTRATDADNHIAGQVSAGDFVFVDLGTAYNNTGWVITDAGTATTPPKGIKIGTDAINWTQFSGAGTYTAGTGITVSGGVIAQDTANGYGLKRYSANVGDGSSSSITVTHSLGTKDVTVQVFDNSTPFGQVECDVNHTTTSAVTLIFSAAPTSGQYRVVVMG